MWRIKKIIEMVKDSRGDSHEREKEIREEIPDAKKEVPILEVPKSKVKDSRGDIHDVGEEYKQSRWVPILFLSAFAIILLSYGVVFWLMAEAEYSGCKTEKKHIMVSAGKTFIPLDITVCKRKGK